MNARIKNAWITIGRTVLWGLLGCGLFQGCGTATPDPIVFVDKELRDEAEPLGAGTHGIGMVENVDTDGMFLILKCTSSLPKPDEQVRIYRSHLEVATASVLDMINPPFVAARILEGRPQRGDVVKP